MKIDLICGWSSIEAMKWNAADQSAEALEKKIKKLKKKKKNRKKKTQKVWMTNAFA